MKLLEIQFFLQVWWALVLFTVSKIWGCQKEKKKKKGPMPQLLNFYLKSDIKWNKFL